MNEEIVKLQAEVANLTQIMLDKTKKEQSAEVKELADKLTELQAEVKERKHQFAVASTIKVDKKELDVAMDELAIARAVCTKTDGSFDRATYSKIVEIPKYAEAIKAFGDVSATDSTTAGAAAEFVAPGFSSTLLEEIFLSLEVGALFKRINMPNATYTFPFSPKRMIAHAGSEGGTVTKVKGTSDKIIFNAQKIMSIVELTDEFEADAIIPALNWLRSQLIDGFALAQETMCLNGDKGTNIYSAALTGEDCRKLVGGIRADAMVTGTKTDLASGGITAANLRALRVKMGKYGKSPKDLAYVLSMSDYLKCLDATNFPNYQTLLTYGAGAQILTGEVGKVDGIPIIVTELIPGAGVATDAADALGGLNASGVWDDTTKTKTTCVLVNRNAYAWGDRQGFSLNLWVNPLYGTTNLIGNQRLDFKKVLLSTDPTSSVGYNY